MIIQKKNEIIILIYKSQNIWPNTQKKNTANLQLLKNEF